MKCPTCPRKNLTGDDFHITRDGKKLRTRQCRHCLRAADIDHNQQQRRRQQTHQRRAM